MKILLTGSTGNLGSHTLSALVERGHQVRCLVRPTKANKRKMAHWEAKPNVELAWGDLCSSEEVERAVDQVEIIIHTAYLIPPPALERPEEAERVNVGGMKALLQAARAQPRPPRFWFASTYAVFGPEATRKEELLTPNDPVESTNSYTEQKLSCEKMLQESGLTWSIYRFSDVVPMRAQQPNKLMYEIPLQTRMEFIHPSDAALAIVNGLEQEAVWGKLLLVGGGKSCQVLYKDYLQRSLSAMGLEMLPESAFNANGVWGTGWMDTKYSQSLLAYQRHSFEEILQAANEATASLLMRWFVPLARPLIQAKMLSYSPYRGA